MQRSLLTLLIASIGLNAYAEEKDWSGSAELGSIRTSGNTDTSSLSSKLTLKHSGEKWDSELRLTALNSKDSGTTSKEKYTGLVQFDRNFTEHSYLAIIVDQERDRFNGFRYQTTSSVGYGYRAINQDNMHLDLEAGPGYRRDKIRTTDTIEEEAIGRIAIKFQWQIREGVQFVEEFVAEVGDSNAIYRSETSLRSQVVGNLATSIGYKVRHVDTVPEGSKKTDTELGVTLVYSF
ncbi:MAG: DUF481 domain-containing protein [Bacterioplanes sp.]|nr:DUF481 domain-containing protein [Bacterioplanes sp.]